MVKRTSNITKIESKLQDLSKFHSMNSSDFGNDLGSQERRLTLYIPLFKTREINDDTSNNHSGLYSNKTILK